MFLTRLRSWLDRDPEAAARRRRASRELPFRPGVESLEERSLMSTLVVNSPLDVTLAGDGLVTLREAIVAANTDTATDLGPVGGGADTIVFDDAIRGQTIQLVQGELSITSDLVIRGPGAPLLTIDANHLSRVLHVTGISGGNVELRGMTLTGGVAGLPMVPGVLVTSGVGGAILSTSSGNLTVADAVVTGNSAATGGGIGHVGES